MRNQTERDITIIFFVTVIRPQVLLCQSSYDSHDIATRKPASYYKSEYEKLYLFIYVACRWCLVIILVWSSKLGVILFVSAYYCLIPYDRGTV